jgi:hypothetical protein
MNENEFYENKTNKTKKGGTGMAILVAVVFMLCPAVTSSSNDWC